MAQTLSKLNFKTKVSIIIPTYNRANVITDTIDSIIAQTYPNWECIIVDDGSTDATEGLINNYLKRDHRFQFHYRPEYKVKGANSCRNYGFEKSDGDYLIWFDSDDLMTPDHIEVKIQSLHNSDYDFVVAKTQNFNEFGFQEPYKYSLEKRNITAQNFILRKIHWYTYDVMLVRDLAGKILFNEQMQSWQDYNYFCKMLLVSTNGFFIDNILTHRRLHNSSIQAKMTHNEINFKKQHIEAIRLTLRDIETKIDNYTHEEMVRNMMNTAFLLAMGRHMTPKISYLFKKVNKIFGLKSIISFSIALTTGFFLKKGESYLNFAKRKS